jgi:hypothetical protein
MQFTSSTLCGAVRVLGGPPHSLLFVPESSERRSALACVWLSRGGFKCAAGWPLDSNGDLR